MADRIHRVEYVIQLRGDNRAKPWRDAVTGIKRIGTAMRELEERAALPGWRSRDARIIHRTVDENVMLERKASAASTRKSLAG